ncbi:Crp/Fnr family transcriptional regulator [Dehalobacter sp. 4CP]|uniref:Crp/Fnr family transcriptional regulator n=1 Tax=Dehalobacter sp. CP TaxID=2594474 RepID=UPI0039EA9DC7|nr:Crp/Fnr family transcriptional regulator [Dehalobacter sp.]
MEENEKCGGAIPDTFFEVERLQEFINLGTVKTYAKGSAVMWPGDKCSSLIYVVSGRLRVNKLLDDGRERLVYFTGKHGLVGKLYETCNDSYAIALEDSKVCFFSKEQLKKIFSLNDEIPFDIIRNYLSKTSYYMKQAAEIDYFNPAVRIVRLFYELYIANGVKTGDHYEINIQLSLENISEITGTHYVTASKVIGWLRKNKVMEKKRKKIIIYDAEKLKMMTQGTHVF